MADMEKEKEKDRDVEGVARDAVTNEQDHFTADEVVFVGEDGLRLFPQPVRGDKLDPLNWTFAQKHVILAIVMAMYFMFTYITTTTVPSFPDLQQAYGATLEQINWTVAIPALGLSLGPLLWASPADIIGRRPILILGTVMALASTIGAALAPTYQSYMAARFFQGLGVSPAANVGLAVINDLFFEHERGRKVGLWVLAIDLGLLCGPLVGGFVDLAGYAWIQWLSAIIFGVILAAELAFLPETLYPRDLMSSYHPDLVGRADLAEKPVASSPGQTAASTKRTRELPFVNVAPVPGVRHPKLYDTVTRFLKTFKYAVVPISVMTYCFAWYWWVLSVVTLVPVAYADYSPQIQGLLFIGLIIGTLVSEIFCSGRLSDWIVVRLAHRNAGVKTPEMRLWLVYPAALLTAIGLVIWGVSVDHGYHWMVGQVAFALFGAGIQIGNTAVCSYIVDAYPMQSMAVMTFYAVLLNLGAFIDPFFIVPWVESAGFTWTLAGHALITVLFCVPAMALLHRYGSRIRESFGVPTWVNPECSKEVPAV
ncbi:major facilitator superfamily transporter [Apiospora rasikravindrae]|uniref:Major facilitator superfamily transporter n=1 Tax=Apiospora rasikravindrae TaxID=990691 RepID=A0ABR1TFQ1_9PEZI